MQTYKKEEDDSVEDQDSVNGITKWEKKKLGKIGIHNLNEYSLCNSKKLFY